MWKYALPNSCSHRDNFLAVAEGCCWLAKVRRLPSFPTTTTINKESLICSGAHSAPLKTTLRKCDQSNTKSPKQQWVISADSNWNCDFLQNDDRPTHTCQSVCWIVGSCYHSTSGLGHNRQLKQMRWDMAEVSKAAWCPFRNDVTDVETERTYDIKSFTLPDHLQKWNLWNTQ